MVVLSTLIGEEMHPEYDALSPCSCPPDPSGGSQAGEEASEAATGLLTGSSGAPDSPPDTGPDAPDAPDSYAAARRRALGLSEPGPGYLEVKIRLVGGLRGGLGGSEEDSDDPGTSPDTGPDAGGGPCLVCGGARHAG